MRRQLDVEGRVPQGLERDGDAAFLAGGKALGLAHGLRHAGEDVLLLVSICESQRDVASLATKARGWLTGGRAGKFLGSST